MSQTLTVADTAGFLALCKDARGSNRSVHIARVQKAINLDGTHIMVSQMLHNDVEWRTEWFVSFKDSPLRPVELTLDVSLEALRKHTYEIDMPAELAEPGKDRGDECRGA